ncbi:cytochrome c [Aquitalea sp.]|uniref:c-type cytochrome n=1 Tax=Aquitalea sp. TaxID=1872623 RepID=UPI00258852D3|nr:cytochrome c [Aquitalea sp.]
MQACKQLTAVAAMLLLLSASAAADIRNGKNLYQSRCAICHGPQANGSGPLASKSSPATPDLTTMAFKKRLTDYPGVIVSSIILRPNGDLIPRTLRDNGIKLPPHNWTVQDLRDVNEYMRSVIGK